MNPVPTEVASTFAHIALSCSSKPIHLVQTHTNIQNLVYRSRLTVLHPLFRSLPDRVRVRFTCPMRDYPLLLVWRTIAPFSLDNRCLSSSTRLTMSQPILLAQSRTLSWLIARHRSILTLSESYPYVSATTGIVLLWQWTKWVSLPEQSYAVHRFAVQVCCDETVKLCLSKLLQPKYTKNRFRSLHGIKLNWINVVQTSEETSRRFSSIRVGLFPPGTRNFDSLLLGKRRDSSARWTIIAFHSFDG